MDWTGNKNSIYKTLGESNHTDKERQSEDYYATDPIAIDKLVKVVNLPKYIWECACGEKHLSNRLEELGYAVYSSDIVERCNKIKKLDFLKANRDDCQSIANKFISIVTNPPYKYAKEFVLKALDLLTYGELCCMFLKLTFLEGKGRYKDLFSKYPPKKILVFSERVLCAPNGNFIEAKKQGSAVAYAWFIWEKGFNGKTTIDWI